MLKNPLEMDLNDHPNTLLVGKTRVNGRPHGRKQIRKVGNEFFSLIPPPPTAQQQFYEALSNSWWNSKSKLWNYTINVDPSARRRNGVWRSFTWKQMRTDFINTIKDTLFCSYIILDLEEFAIFFEIGEKNHKFHCNLCIKIDDRADDRTAYLIREKLMNEYGQNGYSVNFKNHKEVFKQPDIYNMKDASYMTHIGYPPAHFALQCKIPKTLALKQFYYVAKHRDFPYNILKKTYSNHVFKWI
jgi:hypothetical protein